MNRLGCHLQRQCNVLLPFLSFTSDHPTCFVAMGGRLGTYLEENELYK